MKNPYRAGSKNFKVFGAMMGAKKPPNVALIARKTRMPQGVVASVLAALQNPYHNSVGRRAGVSVERKDDGYVAKTVKPDPKANRPKYGSKIGAAKKTRKTRWR